MNARSAAQSAFVGLLPEGATIASESLRVPQRIHALAIVVFPTLGFVAALALALRYGMTRVDLALFAGLSALTMCGISVGYHRLFSHRSFRANTPVRVLLAVSGSMSAQGSLFYWVANHRRHHQFTDRPGDLHSPYYEGERPLGRLTGLWHSHMGWTFDHEITSTIHFAKDLFRDPAIARVNQLYPLWVLLGIVVPALAGGAASGTALGALTGFLWGGLARIFVIYHVTNSIDSITHVFGSRPFDTGDHSTNNPWLVLPTLGEAWHNNHHAFPASAIFGLRWWQVDPGGTLIRGLQRLGWAWEVREPTPELVAARARGKR